MNTQTDTKDLTQEKSTTEETITILIMRVNQSLAELDAQNKFPQHSKPHDMQSYRAVYRDIFELTRLTRASLSPLLLHELDVWRKTGAGNDFISYSIYIAEKIYDELSENGMIDIRARKTATFPIDFYIDQLLKGDK